LNEPNTVPCSVVVFFWECLPFPAILQAQGLRKCILKKQIFSLDLHPNFLGLFNKSVIFPKFSIQIFQSITNQSFLNFQGIIKMSSPTLKLAIFFFSRLGWKKIYDKF
jgi:hypothetical protein